MSNQANQGIIRTQQYLSNASSKDRANKQISSQKFKEYSASVYRKFLQILNSRRQRYLKQHLVQYYGKNFPIDYRQHYQFEQGWEYRGRQEIKTKENYINESSSLLQLTFTILAILVYSFTIWITNLDTFYRNSGRINLYEQTYSSAFSISLIHFLIRVNKGKVQNQKFPKLIEIIKCHYPLIMTMGYLIAKMTVLNCRENIMWIIFELIILFILYKQASNMYESIRLTNFSLQYEYQIKVIDMVLTIFLVAHIIAITLYLTTHLSLYNNWMTPLKIDGSNEYALYAYSFYFCTTTIMTVGYGDITPKNQYEVIVVILVQIFGVVVLGYIINQIGYCVSSLRRERQVIEKDLIVVQKMRKHYRMNVGLTNKVRQYILNSKQNINQLSPDEQRGICNKLNEEIRTNLVSQNMLSVVKSSIFFLCRWSKQFQNQISVKLIHTIFNPNDLLHQPHGNERIYIIKNGKIDIYAGYNSKRLHKILKTINTSAQSEVSDNCYGYTGVISIRRPKIYAVSKGFTSAYFIDKQKFKECVNCKITDIQYYHQLKTKIDQSRLCKSIEISSSQSTKHHYHPTRSLIIKKQSKRNNPQERKYLLRRAKNTFKGNKHYCDTAIRQQIKNKFMDSYAQLYDDSQVNYLDSARVIREQELCILNGQISVITHLNHLFESSKQYANYFVKNNRSKILKALQNEEFILKPPKL